VLDLSRLEIDELVALFRERRADFVERVYVRAEEINVAADFHMKSALRLLEKRGLDAARYLSHIPPTVVHEALARLTATGDEASGMRRFLELFGHRSPKDYELAQKRYSEDPALVQSLADRATHAVPRASNEPDLPAGRC
jgi:hypothetical protein